MADTVVFCPGCGHKRDDDHVFCAHCGRSFGVGKSTARPSNNTKANVNPRPVDAAIGIASGIVFRLTVLALILVCIAVAWATFSPGGYASFLRSGQVGNTPRLPVVPPPYQSQTFSVPARARVPFSVTGIRAGGVIEGYFVVNGGGDDINYSIQAPTGGYLETAARARSRHDFSYIAATDGTYLMTFDNSFSLLTPKVITIQIRSY